MASDILAVPKGDLGNYLPNLDLSKVSSTQDHLFTSKELDDVLGVLEARLVAEINMVKADYPSHIAMILIRAYDVTTSPKAKYVGQISYVINSNGAATSYTLKDEFIFPAIIDAGKKYGKSNTLRAFCSTLQECFLAVAKHQPEYFERKRATRLGTPALLGYLSADFLTGTSGLVDNMERSVINRSTEYALSKQSNRSSTGALVSLYDYGRY